MTADQIHPTIALCLRGIAPPAERVSPSEARAAAEVSKPVPAPARRSGLPSKYLRHPVRRGEDERILAPGRGKFVFRNGLRRRRQYRQYTLNMSGCVFYGSLWYRAAAYYALERAEGTGPSFLLVRPE